MTPKEKIELRNACEVFERYARTIGKDVQILLTNDGVEVAPLAAPGSSTGQTLFEAMEDVLT